MIDTTLIKNLKILAKKEKTINEYKRRMRVKGTVKEVSKTKKENITLTIEKNEDEYKFTVLKFHKERFALANTLKIGNSISVAGIPKFKIIICTHLKILEKGIIKGKQETLKLYTQGVTTK